MHAYDRKVPVQLFIRPAPLRLEQLDCYLRLWITLSRQELESVIQWCNATLTRQDQLPADASVRWHEAFFQEDPNIRFTALGHAAGILQTHIRRQPLHNNQQVRIDSRWTRVANPDAVDSRAARPRLLRLPNLKLRGNVEKLQPLVAACQRIVVIDRQATWHEPVLGPEGGEIRPVLRVSEVHCVRLERVRAGLRIVCHERRVIQAVLDEVGEIVDLVFGKPQSGRVSRRHEDS